jgi:nucleotide-binding universal stress UspA family protein
MSMKILLPVDGSASSLRAVDHLLHHSEWFRDTPEIHLLHVHAPIPIGRVQAHVGKETLHDYYLQESRELMSEAEAMLKVAGRAYTPHIHVGLPAEVIAKVAGELGVDMVVMGTHGWTGVAGLLMGSVASGVLHLVNCPVLLVK